MDAFHKDILKFGSLVGLKYFQFYLRGREELVVKVILPTADKKEPPPPSRCFLVTLYYKKAIPIVYTTPDSTSDDPKARQQVDLKLKCLKNWKTSPTRLRDVLEELLVFCCADSKVEFTV